MNAVTQLINLFKRFLSIFLAVGNNVADSVEGEVNILKQKIREEEAKAQKAENDLTDLMAQLALTKGEEKNAESERIAFEKLALEAHAAGNLEKANEHAVRAAEWRAQETIHEESIMELEPTVQHLTEVVDNAINNVSGYNNQIKIVNAKASANKAALSIANSMSDLNSDGLSMTLKGIKERTDKDGEKAKAMLSRQNKRTASSASSSSAIAAASSSGSALEQLLASKKPKEEVAAA